MVCFSFAYKLLLLKYMKVCSVPISRFSTVVGVLDIALPLALLFALLCGPEFIKMSK